MHHLYIIKILFEFFFQECCFAGHLRFYLTYPRVLKKCLDSDLSQMLAMLPGLEFQVFYTTTCHSCILSISEILWSKSSISICPTVFLMLFANHLDCNWLTTLRNGVPVWTETYLPHQEGWQYFYFKKRFYIYHNLIEGYQASCSYSFSQDGLGPVTSFASNFCFSPVAQFRGLDSMLLPYLACYPLIRLLASLCLFEATGRLCKGCLVRDISLVGRGVIASWKTRHYCSFFPSY